MANTWVGSTPNLALDVYNIKSVLSDDISGEQLLASIIGSTNSNTTKIDTFAGNASVKPGAAVQGNLGVYDDKRNVIDSGKSIAPTVGTDDSSVPTGKGVRDFVLQQQLVHTDYQGMFDYFGSQAQVEAVTANAGEIAIIYLGTQTNVTGVQKGTYNGTNWTFVDVSPSQNNGMWIFAMQLLGENNTPFGIAVYKNDGTNPPSFDSAPFPMFRPDNTDITLDGNGNLTLATKGTAGTYGETTNKNLDFGDTFKITQQTTDTKGRTASVVEREMTLPEKPTIGNGTVTVNQGGEKIASFTLNQSGNVTVNIEDTQAGASVYDTIVELNGDTGEIIQIAVNAVQIPQGDEIILGQTLVADAGFNGANTGGTIGRIESYVDSPTNSIVNVKIITKIGNGGGGGFPIGNVTNLASTYGNHIIELKWNDPPDNIMDDTVLAQWRNTKVVRKIGSYPNDENDGVVVVDNSIRNQYATTGFSDTGLDNDVTYFYHLFPYSTGGVINRSEANRISATPNEVPTGNVTSFTATSGFNSVTLKWTDPTDTFWQSTRIVRKTGSYPANENDGTIVVNATTRNQYSTNGFVDSGLTNDIEYFYQAFPIAQDGSINKNAANRVTATPSRIVIPNTPAQSGTLTYNGNAQSPTWNNYDSEKMTLSGVTSGTNAGTYTATFTPTAMYKWSDGTVGAKNVSWNIGKASGSLSINPTSLTLNTGNLTGSITVTRAGDGVISAVSNNTNIATVSVSGNIVTVNNVGQASGSATITVSVAAGTNHLAPSNQTCAVSAEFVPSHNKTFNSNTWAQITAVSNYIEANSLTTAQITSTFGWNVGDTKTITMDGNNYTIRIIGFRHDNKTGGGKAGITLDMQHCYGTATSNRRYMNSSNTNVGGWNSSYMRQTVMPELLAKLPSDLQSALKSVDKLTSAGNNSSSIGTTSDKLFLPSEKEIFGSLTYSFTGEGSQYALYLANNNITFRIKQQPIGTNYGWWLRSPYSGSATYFCIVNSDGNADISSASNARGVSFGLCV